jgi:hypothetical protein
MQLEAMHYALLKSSLTPYPDYTRPVLGERPAGALAAQICCCRFGYLDAEVAAMVSCNFGGCEPNFLVLPHPAYSSAARIPLGSPPVAARRKSAA